MRKIDDAFWDIGANPAFHSKISESYAWEATQKNQIQKFMNEAGEILINAGFGKESVKVDIHDSQAGIARDIIKESNNGYMAVVAGRRGTSKVKEFVMGSVARKLVERQGNVPVWVVGGRPWAEKVLLALDSSEGAMKAVDHVGAILGGSNCEVTLVNILRYPDFIQPEINDLPASQKSVMFEQTKAEIIPLFDDAKKRLINAGIEPELVTTKLITGTSRAGAIVEEARHGGYGTIVIGRRGMSKVKEFFIGRVSNKVINMTKEMAIWVVS
jgi:nucleotide-binding universal stress UspA family protein